MKHIKLAIILLVPIFTFFSCNQNIHKPAAMTRAEKIMDENPDSARHLLETLKPNMAKENKATQMYYNLLTVKANDKCYIPHTSDSLMLEVVKYYEHHGEPRQLMEAYYYLASVYRDLNQVSQSLDYFHKALGINTNDSYILEARCNNQIGQTYMYQKMFKDARLFFEKSLQSALKAKDTTIIIYSLRDIGRSYSSQKEYSKGILYFNKAIDLAKTDKNDYLRKMVLAELSGTYREDKEYEKAKQCLIESKNFDNPLNKVPYFSNLAELYRSIGKTDSACFYFEKVLNSDNVMEKQAASYKLAIIYNSKNDARQAYKYLEQCLLNTDSINEIHLSENTNLISSLNQKLAIEKENSRLQKIALQQKITIVFFLFTFIVIALFTTIYLKNRQLKAREQKKRINRILASQKKNSEETIQANTRKIKELEESLASSNQHADDLELQVLLLEKEQLQSQNKEIEIECKKRVIDREKLEQTEIYKRFKLMTTSGKPTRSDYRELEVTLNQLFDNFTFRLKKLYPYWSNNDIKLCLLIKIGLNPKEIKNITGNTDSNISMIRKRLLKKILGKDDKPKVFDQFIKDL